MKRLSKKGFTLVELLAVVVILGILMLVALPAIQKAIQTSKKGTFVDSAKEVVSAVKSSYASDELGSNCPSGTNGNYKVSLSKANDLMETPFKSPFSKGDEEGNVVISVDNNGKATYYVCIKDKGGAGTNGYKDAKDLNKGDIVEKGATGCSGLPDSISSAQPCD